MKDTEKKPQVKKQEAKEEAPVKKYAVFKSQPSKKCEYDLADQVFSLETVLLVNQKAAKAICDRIAKLEQAKVDIYKNELKVTVKKPETKKQEAPVKKEAVVKTQPSDKSKCDFVNLVVSLESDLIQNQDTEKSIGDRITKLEQAKVTI